MTREEDSFTTAQDLSEHGYGEAEEEAGISAEEAGISVEV